MLKDSSSTVATKYGYRYQNYMNLGSSKSL